MNYRLGIAALVALHAAFASSAQAPCVCARNFRPVCGSDGVTYANECRLNCERSKGKTDLTLQKTGPCKDEDITPVCVCTMEYKPVCGNDGDTYPNRCALECKPNVQLAHDGQCNTVKVAEIKYPEVLCICTDDLDTVCGSDGKSYPNPCQLNCATAKDNTLSIKHKGQCPDAVQVAEQPTPCVCTRNMKPVCGSNGVTYNNLCELNCATANDNTLSVKHNGACGVAGDVIVVDQPSCTCTRKLEPVCGANGVTYSNDCLLACAGQSLAKYGEC